MKVDQHGQAAIISDADYVKIRRCLKNKKHRLLLDVARYTGERLGAIVQLRVGDIYNADGSVKSAITFRAATCKASPDGKRKTRTCPMHPTLKEILEGYNLPDSEWLFPSQLTNVDCHISLRAADLAFRAAIAKAGLDHKGYSTHSTRRTFITRLWEKGCDIHTIQLLTGHSDLKSLIRYVEADPNRVKKAIALL